MHADLARIDRVRAEHRARDLGAAGAHQSGEAENLAAPQREADIANRATARQPAHFERDVVRGRIGRRAEFGRELAADHHRDDRVH